MFVGVVLLASGSEALEVMPSMVVLVLALACCWVVLVGDFHLRAAVLVAALAATLVGHSAPSMVEGAMAVVAAASRLLHLRLVVDHLHRRRLCRRTWVECPLTVMFLLLPIVAIHGRN